MRQLVEAIMALVKEMRIQNQLELLAQDHRSRTASVRYRYKDFVHLNDDARLALHSEVINKVGLPDIVTKYGERLPKFDPPAPADSYLYSDGAYTDSEIDRHREKRAFGED